MAELDELCEIASGQKRNTIMFGNRTPIIGFEMCYVLSIFKTKAFTSTADRSLTFFPGKLKGSIAQVCPFFEQSSHVAALIEMKTENNWKKLELHCHIIGRSLMDLLYLRKSEWRKLTDNEVTSAETVELFAHTEAAHILFLSCLHK